MAKKKDNLEAKLGSWTDQANLTRGTQPMREEYQVERSLMDRIATTAAKHGLNKNELVGYLLTYALDQVDAGAHKIHLPTT